MEPNLLFRNIIDILKDHEDFNLGSESAREFIAKKIMDSFDSGCDDGEDN